MSSTFLDFLHCPVLDSLDADIAILGIPFSDPYSVDEITNDQSNAPAAVRTESHRLSYGLDHWDFDLGGTLFNGENTLVVDCGNVSIDPENPGDNHQRAEKSVRTILNQGALPIVIGGDHGVTIPVIRAFSEQGPITLIHIDAHIDWRDEINGVREGYSSPIKRASEMGHIGNIFQIGMRAQGSARAEEVKDALAYGSQIITAYEVHEKGMESILERIPSNERYYLSIDADGFDPALMPAVEGPAPGGLLYYQVRTLIHQLITKGRLLGMDIVEITPKRDLNGITALTAGQLILNMIGMTVRAGYFRK